MAQKILQKRSLIAGKVPDTGSLLVGELGVNVYDGKVYLHKSGSSQSIQTLVTTNSITTGSITLTGTGSFGEASIDFDANIGPRINLILLDNSSNQNSIYLGVVKEKSMPLKTCCIENIRKH